MYCSSRSWASRRWPSPSLSNNRRRRPQAIFLPGASTISTQRARGFAQWYETAAGRQTLRDDDGELDTAGGLPRFARARRSRKPMVCPRRISGRRWLDGNVGDQRLYQIYRRGTFWSRVSRLGQGSEPRLGRCWRRPATFRRDHRGLPRGDCRTQQSHSPGQTGRRPRGDAAGRPATNVAMDDRPYDVRDRPCRARGHPSRTDRWSDRPLTSAKIVSGETYIDFP